MKKLIISLAAVVTISLLSGCVAVPVGDWDGSYEGRAYPQGQRHDRDGDGVPDRHDRKPNNPNRY